MPKTLDLDIQSEQVSGLTSADALAAFLHELGYQTGKRQSLSPKGMNLGEAERAVTQAEILSQDDEGMLRVVFARVKSITKKIRDALVVALGRDPVVEHLLILTSDFDTLEFVLIDKERREHRGVHKKVVTAPRARIFVVPRRWPENSLRLLRRLTYNTEDGARQYDKLLAAFEAADYSSIYFTNRALFSDHFLETRLKDTDAWRDLPAESFRAVGRLVDSAPDLLRDQSVAEARCKFYDPIWSILGFTAAPVERGKDGVITPDFRLSDAEGHHRAVALVYPWGRWLDGPAHQDEDRPDENPGAAVVSLLEKGEADWAIVTNGRQWRLYSRAAHSRSTNFYEVDLRDALVNTGESDPTYAFRYWWLFFRLEAFMPVGTPDASAEKVWLDTIVEGSREYAREVETELKKRVFYDVVPVLADGFLHDRRTRLNKRAQPKEDELELIRQGTLTLLYRILFLLYAESRDLLPVREDTYYRLSLKRLKEEVADTAGVSLSEADGTLRAKFKKKDTAIYDGLSDRKSGLFAAMALGSVEANVPRYNGGLFRLDPSEAADPHEAEICAFLNEHKVPDEHLAIAIDRLARVENPKFKGSPLEFVDYKALGVRQLGSIYEGLLEFKIAVATEDVGVVVSKKKTEFIALGKDRGGKTRGRKRIEREYRKGEPMLVRDKAERKATGSYYTPDHIVEYIVENTVGPVLKRKTEALRDDFRKAEKTYHRWLTNAKADARIMLGWRPPEGAEPMEGPPGKPTVTDRRRFAQDKCYEEHKDLVEQLFDLKVLDPAMGSGHFLVEAVDYITDELLDFLNSFPVNPVSAAIEKTRDAIIASLREQGLEPDAQFRKRLTDVHLLKRHVLKRCIYGVDLNPLATELAKVSLWLDAFTLGAPLSFLDHHLRTGNSLIGSSIADLEKELEGQLFRIDEQHLRVAVQNVLTVARLADATAAEVAESKRAFETARKTLTAYGVLLDILVARHFGLGDATAALLEMSPQLDFETIDAFRKSFRAAIESGRLPENDIQKFFKARGIETKSGVRADALDAVATLAEERRFFHWDLEFPEVFYKLTGIDKNRVERKAEGEAGFDAVVGNPPWGASVSSSSALVSLLTSGICRNSSDSYAMFMARLSVYLCRHGLLCFITPDTYLRKADYDDLRSAMLHGWTWHSLVETGPVFKEVQDTWCAMAIMERAVPAHSHCMRHYRVSRYLSSVAERLRHFKHNNWWQVDSPSQSRIRNRKYSIVPYWTAHDDLILLDKLDGLPTIADAKPRIRVSRGEEGSKRTFNAGESGSFALMLPENVRPYACEGGTPTNLDALTPGKIDSFYKHPKLWIVRIQKLRWVPRLVCAVDSRRNSAAMKTLQMICVPNDNEEYLATLALWLASDWIEFWCTAHLLDDLNQAFIEAIPFPGWSAFEPEMAALVALNEELARAASSVAPKCTNSLSLLLDADVAVLRGRANAILGKAAGFSDDDCDRVAATCSRWRIESAVTRSVLPNDEDS